MDVDCEGCAGCCIDWRALAPDLPDPEREGSRQSLDDVANMVPLERDEVRAFLEAGYGDAMTPRLWTLPERAGADESASTHEPVAVDGHRLAAIDGRPVFYVGLRKPPKPVAPFGREAATWLSTCAFLDPATLQCRIHGDDLYPDACAAYPGYNLLLDQETECERVEAVHGGERLLDDEPPTDRPGVGLGPQALGAKLFAHPDPDHLSGRIERIARGEPTARDRATFVAVAAASAPGTLSVDDERRERARERVLDADSWVGLAIADWTERAGASGEPVADDPGDPIAGDAGEPAADDADEPDRAPHFGRKLGHELEDRRGAPGTPGWD